MSAKFTNEHVKILKKDGIGVIPTDTLYGVVGSYFSGKAEERIKKARKVLSKPNGWVTLISDVDDLQKVGVAVDEDQKKLLKRIWPGSFSVGFRGSPNAFRVPENKELRGFLAKTGPLIAPSANITGESPAKNIEEAQNYFHDAVDFYINAGVLDSEPSTVLVIDGLKVSLIREGKGDISVLKEYITDIIK